MAVPIFYKTTKWNFGIITGALAHDSQMVVVCAMVGHGGHRTFDGVIEAQGAERIMGTGYFGQQPERRALWEFQKQYKERGVVDTSTSTT